MRLETRQIVVTVVAIAGFLILGECVGKPKEQTKPINNIASSSIKEDKKAIKQKQLAHLKEHEQEIVDFVKAQNLKVESVKNIGMKLSGAWQEMEHLKVVTK